MSINNNFTELEFIHLKKENFLNLLKKRFM